MSAITSLLRIIQKCVKNTFLIYVRLSSNARSIIKKRKKKKEASLKVGIQISSISHRSCRIAVGPFADVYTFPFIIMFVKTIDSRESVLLNNKVFPSLRVVSESRNSQSFTVLQTSPPTATRTCSSPILLHQHPAQSPAGSTAQLPD
jgi:hypothetical protein